MAESATLEDLSTRAAHYVRSAAKGVEYVITENGEPVALLRSFRGEEVRPELTAEERRALVERIVQTAHKIGQSIPPGVSVVETLSRLRDEREAALIGRTLAE